MSDDNQTRRWTSGDERCGESGHCVEVCFEADQVLVRSSREPLGAVLTFSMQEWAAFCASVAAGQLRG
jgi:hypothetical protein